MGRPWNEKQACSISHQPEDIAVVKDGRYVICFESSALVCAECVVSYRYVPGVALSIGHII